MPMILIY